MAYRPVRGSTMFRPRMGRPVPLFHALILFGIGLIAFYIYQQDPELPPPRVVIHREPDVFNRRPLKAILKHHHPHYPRVNHSFLSKARTKRDLHYNVTRIRKMQNITRKYFDPKRHIIYYSDLDVFIEKCDYQTFTLRDSPKSPCNVVHTPIKHYRTCAVVGNGGILLESNCGAEIDSHDFVIRPNLPPVLKYRTDVGSRTNLTLVNGRRLTKISLGLQSVFGKSLETAMPWIQLFDSPGMIFCYSLIFSKKRQADMRVVNTAIKMYNKTTITAFPSASLVDSNRVYKELAGKEWDYPSTGLNAVALASTFCDKISIYGFYPMPMYQSKRVFYHYYDKHTPSGSHDFDGEFATLQQLDADGIIRHVVGKCKPDVPT
ncbi:CMP-N-acetylneuraminate-poly-alpha-2,8-sialyltransferase-like [Branchiostoma lanceolatum]|uniref:CMP-N-acetylneuraminate-poly-alpha-2, 8-sialyltransferase-like n=1 Tax=Branchiostoma lanceolatum TaxID=7740 RepID=UPI0034533C76